MSMIDPITRLPTPLNMLGGRQVLGGFPVPGVTGLASQAAQVAPSAATNLPSWATGLAGRVAPGSIGGQQALTAANALGGGGQAGGLLSRLPSLGGLTGSGGTWKALGTGAKLGRGLGASVLGEAGSRIIDATNIGGQNSNLEQGLQGAAQGAAAGALIGAPFFGVGAGVGAAVGGALGGAVGVLGNVFGLGGGDEAEPPDPLDILDTAIEAANLSPEQSQEILQTYAVMEALAEAVPEGEERDAKMLEAQNTAAAMILQKMQEQEAVSQIGGGSADMLALQAQAQDIFAPLATNIEDSGRMYAQALQGSMADLPPEYRAIAQTTAARELSSSQKLANAYKAQAAVIPTVNALTQYQRDYQALASQMFQQATQQQMAGAGSQQQADVSALLTAGV